MDFSEIKEVIELFESGSIRELELKQEDLELYLNKNETNRQITAKEVTTSNEKKEPATQLPEKTDIKTTITPTEKPVEQSTEGKTVTSPIVGIVYTASDPSSPVFVNVGDKVAVGDTLCIIEAMKIMNEVKSDTAGTITEILINNEDVVEYGQDLFRIV